MPITAPPIDFNAVRAGLVRAAVAALGLPASGVIVREPEVVNSPRPPLPYLSLKIMTAAMRYGDDVGTPIDDNTWNYGGPRSMAVSFQAYGTTHEEALGLMATWQAALDQPPTLDALGRAGLAVWTVGAVADISILVNTGYEGRAQMDCVFGLASNTTIRLDTIVAAPVSGTITLEDSLEQTITLP